LRVPNPTVSRPEFEVTSSSREPVSLQSNQNHNLQVICSSLFYASSWSID